MKIQLTTTMTLKTLKTGLVAASLLLASTVMAGGDSGGGGNSDPRATAGKHEVQEAIQVQPFFQLQVFKALTGMAKQKKDLGLLVELAKTFNFNKFISNVIYKPQAEPCINDGVEVDAAAILPNTVCLSIDRLLKHQYSNEEILSQVSALTAHEIIHLMRITSARHLEINRVQKEVSTIVGKTLVFDMLTAYTKLSDNMTQESAFMNIEANQGAGLPALCTSASMGLVAITDAAEDVERVSKSIQVNFPIGTQADNYLTEAKYRIISVLINGCGMRSVDPLFSTIENLFSVKSAVSAYDITFATNHTFTRITEQDFLAQECGFNSFDCSGEKRISLNKVKTLDANAIYAELKLAETAYRNYYRIADSLAKQVEKLEKNSSSKQ